MRAIEANCPECNAPIGACHEGGCSAEQCPECGGQMISCGCHYAYFNIDRNTMEEKHPDIFYDGLPDHMAEQYDAYIQPQLIPWTGYWPGVVECSAYGLWAKWTAHGWQRCDSSHPEATEDLNTLAMMGRWNKEQKRFVLREEFLAVLALRERKAVTE